MKTYSTWRWRWTTYVLVVCATYLALHFYLRGSRQGSLRSTTRVVAQTTHLGPISGTCKLFPYERYYRAKDFKEMRVLGRRAKPGDMVELVAGVHSPHRARLESTDGEGKCATWPTRALDGTVFKLHGEPGRLITFCGSRERTIIDGGKGSKGGAGLQVVQSSYVRFAGFTIRNMLRAVDIQDTSHAEILYITSEKTWHEGFRCVVDDRRDVPLSEVLTRFRPSVRLSLSSRVRYNSTSNLLKVCVRPNVCLLDPHPQPPSRPSARSPPPTPSRSTITSWKLAWDTLVTERRSTSARLGAERRTAATRRTTAITTSSPRIALARGFPRRTLM